MKKIHIKWIAIFLLSFFIVTNDKVYAAEHESVGQSEEKLFETKEEAAEYLNQKLLNREDVISVPLSDSLYDNDDILESLLYDAEGFYETSGAQCSFTYLEGGVAFVIEPQYKITKEQNDELLKKIDTVLDGLNIEGKSEYQIVRLIYNYICDNVNYDYTYTKSTSYDALIGGESVCQGYANLFYRMCREAGLSVRTVSGIGNGQSHAWNIVKIGDYYYNVDATWDGQSDVTMDYYFLKNQIDFEDHVRDGRYDTDEYNKKHVMAEDSWMNFDLIQGNVILSKEKLSIDKGDIVRLDVYIEGIKRNAQFFNWKSTDNAVVTVDINGNIKALRSGKAIITCEINEVIECQCEVNVEEPVILNGLIQSSDGNWYYYKNGAVYVEYTGLIKHKGEWLYIAKGKLGNSYVGLVKYKSKWVYVNKGKLDESYTGLVKYKSKWVYVKKGTLDVSYTGLVKYKSKWVYVKKGTLDASYTGLVKYKSSWVYVNKGNLDVSYTGMAKNQYGWWYVTKGKLDYTFTGIANNPYGSWYLQNGKLDLTFSGKVTIAEKIYSVKNGKVKLLY